MKTKLLLSHVLKILAKRIVANRVDLPHVFAFLQCNTMRKLSNFFLIELEKKIGKTVLRGNPYIMFLELNNICNLHCPFCMTGKGIYGGREKRNLTFEEARRIIDQIAPYLYFIQLYNWGEPLLNKELFAIIRYARGKNIYTMASSNMTLMTTEKAESLVESGLDYLKVAIDGLDGKTNSLYRRGSEKFKVMDNFRNLLTARKRLKSATPFVEWQFVVFRHNEDEVTEAARLAKEIGVDYFNPLPAYTEDASWTPMQKEFRKKVYDPESVLKCRRLWSHLNIRCDGGVSPCCYEFFKKDDFANIFAEPFANIWNSKIMHYSRELCLHPERIAECCEMQTICYKCIKSGKRPSLDISEIERLEKTEDEHR